LIANGTGGRKEGMVSHREARSEPLNRGKTDTGCCLLLLPQKEGNVERDLEHLQKQTLKVNQQIRTEKRHFSGA